MLRKIKRIVHGSRTYYRYGGVAEAAVGVTRLALHRANLQHRRRRWDEFKRTHRELVVPLAGIRLQLNPTDAGISAELAIEGTHEPIATELLLRHVKPGMTVLDIGANLGYYAIQESKLVGPQGKVIAIEPAPATYALLRQNALLNQCQNMELVHGAVSDAEGEAELFVAEHANVSRLGHRDDYVDRVVVPTYRVDDLVANEPRVDIVRMDIEGHEVQAIAGMLTTLREKRPVLVAEIHFPMLTNEQIRTLLQHIEVADYRLGGFVFRFCDEIVFGRLIGRRANALKHTSANDLAEMARSEFVVAFFLPRERNAAELHM